MNNAENLAGKAALVTGSATGVGQGIALALAQAGARVVVTYNRDPADETQRLIREAGGTSIAVKTDIRDRLSIRNLCAEAVKAFGRLDILVNNAAVQMDKPILDYLDEELDWVIGVNLKGYWRCIQEALPYLRKAEHGRIINVSSIHGKRPTGFDGIYASTKGGIKMLTREAALAFGKYGITVNTIAPGSIRIAPRTTQAIAPKQLVREPLNFKNFPPGNFLSGRPGCPADIGYCAVFLADDRSQFITGSTLRADGGAMMI